MSWTKKAVPPKNWTIWGWAVLKSGPGPLLQEQVSSRLKCRFTGGNLEGVNVIPNLLAGDVILNPMKSLVKIRANNIVEVGG